jgi:lactate dehydrogenase-like 2-hydroxyacid dehydrogenase
MYLNMSKSIKLLITRQFPKDVLSRAERDYSATINPGTANWQGDELVAKAEGMDGIFLSAGNKFTSAVISGLPESVKIISTFSAGYEHIDLEAAKRRGLVVTNTPGVPTEATADIALLLLLNAARRVREGFETVAKGEWKGWTPTQLLGVHPAGRRLAVLGMGRIGRAVAHRARAFGMEIHYHNRSRLDPELELGATYHKTPEDLFRVADFLSINCELTMETAKLINSETIALLPDNPIIINTARGGIVDDEALISALRSGRVFAAGLDVFEGEPLLNPEYCDLPNAFLTPHMGSATVDTRNQMGFRVLDNLDAYFNGKEPPDRLE